MKLVQHVEIDPSWPEYGVRGDGTPIRLADVETILPAGEHRAVVYFVHERGHKVWPWKDAGYYVDDEGNPLAPVFDIVPMTRAQLESRGLDDATLEREHRRFFPDAPSITLTGPDVAEVQVLRRRTYDAVCAEWYKR